MYTITSEFFITMLIFVLCTYTVTGIHICVHLATNFILRKLAWAAPSNKYLIVAVNWSFDLSKSFFKHRTGFLASCNLIIINIIHYNNIVEKAKTCLTCYSHLSSNLRQFKHYKFTLLKRCFQRFNNYVFFSD